MQRCKLLLKTFLVLVQRWQIRCSKRVLEGVKRTTDQEVWIPISQIIRNNNANGH